MDVSQNQQNIAICGCVRNRNGTTSNKIYLFNFWIVRDKLEMVLGDEIIFESEYQNDKISSLLFMQHKSQRFLLSITSHSAELNFMLVQNDDLHEVCKSESLFSIHYKGGCYLESDREGSLWVFSKASTLTNLKYVLSF